MKMNECTNKHIAAMIHHYELGLLDNKDRLIFEQHLLECDMCFDKFQSMQEVATLMKVDPSIRDLTRSAAASGSADTRTDIAPPFYRRRFKPKYLPAFLAAAIVLIILILKDWRIDIHPSHEASAFENRLAIMYFENLVDESDPDRIGEIITNLLIADLSESGYLQIISSQRMRDVLGQLGSPDRKTGASDLASDIAVRTHSRWLLYGSILQIEPNLVVTTQLVEAISGRVQSTRRIDGDEADDIFSIVDSLTVYIKQDLILPSGALEEPDPGVANVTTSSQDAYRYYLDGIEYMRKLYNREAIASFRKALEYDSTFAMAYYYLADLVDSGYIERALHFSGNINWREKMYIMARHAIELRDYRSAIAQLEHLLNRDSEDKNALLSLGGIYYSLGNYNESRDLYKRVLEIDPTDKGTYNMLSYAYRELNDHDSSIWAINKYIELAPDEANPYDTRGDLYSSVGKLSEAIASYRKALAIKPEFYGSLEKLGHMLVFKREFARADSCYQVLAGWDDPIVISRSRNFPPYIFLYQGKFSQSLELLDRGIRLDEHDGQIRNASHLRQLKALIYAETGKLDSAMIEIQLCLENEARIDPDDKLSYRDLYIRLLAQSGRLDEAESQVAGLKIALENSGLSAARYWSALAIVEKYKGNLDSSVACLDRYAAEKDISPYFSRRFLMARTYFEVGRLADAVAEFEKLTSSYSSIHLYWGIFHAKAYYFLGRAYEESRWYNRAIEQYRFFLDRWRDSDYPSPELDDARLRLANLLNAS